MTQILFEAIFKVDSSQVDKATASVKTMTAATNESAAGVSAIAGEADKAVAPLNRMASAHAGVNRELLVLAHEATMGNWSRFGGSLMVLGERTNALGTAFRLLGSMGAAAGIALGATVAAAAAVGVAFYQAHKETKDFNAALYLTNNYAGLTNDSFKQLSTTIAGQVTASYGTASAAVMGLAKSGQFTKEQIGLLAPMIVNDSRVSGEAVDKLTDEWNKLAASPTKFMEAFNSSHNIYTPKQQEKIRLLEETGRKQDAVTEAVKAYAEYQNGAGKKAIEDSISGWTRLGIVFSEIWKNFKLNIGADALDTVAALKAIESKIAYIQAGGVKGDDAKAQLKQLLDERATLLANSREDERLKARDAENAKYSRMQQDETAYNSGHVVNLKTRMATELAALAEHLSNQKALYERDGVKGPLLDPTTYAQTKQDIIDRNTVKAKDPREKQLEQVMRPAADPYAIYNESLTKLLDNSAHYSELMKVEIELRKIDADVAAKNAVIDQENAAREKFNKENAIRIHSGLTEAKKMLNKLDADSLAIQIEKDKARSAGSSVDENRALDLQKSQYAGLDAIVRQYNDTISKQIDFKRKSVEAIADEVVKQKILNQLELDIIEIKKTQYTTDAQREAQLKRISDLQVKAAADTDAVTAATKRLTDAQKDWAGRGIDTFVTSLGTLQQGLEKITTNGLKGFSDSMYQLITTGKSGFKDMVASMLDQIAKLIFQMYVVIPLINSMKASMAGSGFMGTIGSLLGMGGGGAAASAPAFDSVYGAAADGATITGNNGGRSILVGEKGPEIFIPKGPGTIVPNNAIGGGGSNTVQINTPITVQFSGDAGSAADRGKLAKQMSDLVDVKISNALIQAQRSGGTLNPIRSR
jgi:phage-related minor tail protein